MNNRHIQLIAIGGAIGTGLFLGSGQTISLTGPSLLFTYMIIRVVLFAFMRALGELLLSNTRFNSFVDIANEYLGPFGGFVIGWTYWLCWIVWYLRPNCDGTILCILVSTSPKLDYRAIYCFNLD
ncbi:hypothetical protein ACVQ90_15375 [Staphylococcus aureus]